MERTQGEFFRSAIVVFVAIVAIFAAQSAHAAIFDPASEWRTIETRHFRVHFPARIEEVARKSAKILEEVYPEVTEKWDHRPWGYTEVVLVDNTDDANGLSSVLPYNWMLIYVVPPLPDSSLAHYDDWLRTLLIHEYTHIVQLDAFGGVWHAFRPFLGKLIAPSGVSPTWVREGIAQFDETIMTAGGRGRGSYSEMVIRTAVLSGTFLHIDEADGLGWRWPGYRGAYIYGIKFIQWLVDTYGEEKFMEFDRRVRSSILLAMINHQARNVWGKTFYELWSEWQHELETKYQMEAAKIASTGLSEVEEIVTNDRDVQNSAPTLSRGGDKLVYTATSPHTKPQIRMRDMDSGETFVLHKGQGAPQFSWSPDGTKIVYAAMGGYKRYYRYFDLWLYDFNIEKERKRIKKLTVGMRARNPDFDPSGLSIVFVVGDKGTDVLKRMDIETKEITTITDDVPLYTQFANPRVSPDGKYIAVSVWKPGEGWRIYRYDSNGTNPLRVTKSTGLVVENRPIWSPDGRYIIYASDESGISNLYRVSSEGGEARRITNVLAGVFQPTISANGKIVAQYYTPTGFEIGGIAVLPVSVREQVGERPGLGTRNPRPETRNPKPKSRITSYESQVTSPESQVTSPEIEAALKSPPPRRTRAHTNPGSVAHVGECRPGECPESHNSPGEADDVGLKSHEYVAFSRSLFLPRFVAPNIGILDNAVYISFTTGGSDVLRWHNWLGGPTYRTDAKHLGYFFQYWYNRFVPIFGASVSDFAVDFGNMTFVNVVTGELRTVHLFEHRRALNSFFMIPIQKHSIVLGYFFEDHMAKTALSDDERGALNLGHFAGFRAVYQYGDAERYPASISKENGRNIRLTASVTNNHLGSGDRNEQIIFAGDWREFVLLGRHNVIALRAAGGMTWGDRFVQGTFGLGGSLGEGTFGSGGSYNYFPLRGLPVSALSRTRAMLFSGEYRFPLISMQRGIGTVPFFMKGLSGALFADYGNAWNAHEGGCDSLRTFFDNFMLGTGAELRGDFIVGHGLPVHGRLGYGVVVLNRGRLGALTDPLLGSNVKYGILILALGAAF